MSNKKKAVKNLYVDIYSDCLSLVSILFNNDSTAVTWLKYCWYDVKHYPINQSINQYNDCSYDFYF